MRTLFFIVFVFLYRVVLSQDSVQIHKDNTYKFFSEKGINMDSVKEQHLYYKIYEWIGTKYKYAGETKRGIDCSGFVTEIYRSVYCHTLTGGSADIYKVVTPIEKKNLEEGDLVFFKIKKGRISHVGIYIGQNKIAHASVHSGVVISDLSEDYYKKYFYKGGKITTY